jgi:tRNA (mo5U34)-methyltransferase
MTTLDSGIDLGTLQQEVYARRLWYHDIEIIDGLRTRFKEDYDVNPVLRSIDAATRMLRERIENLTPPLLEGKTVLDVGSADGYFTFWAARRGADHVVGVERNRYNHEHATFIRSTLGLQQVDLYCGSLERHCPDEPFDIVLCLGLIYHLVEPLRALNELRRRCCGQLFVSGAIDLPEDGGAPLARLDRYAVGSHGMWSFNAAMVRQMLSTAGFEIAEEAIDHTEGGRHYFTVASPAQFAEHHVFADTIDQEFPINLDRRRDRVRQAWKRLGRSANKPIVIFGAGTHTPWLLGQVADIRGPEVAFVIDDRIAPEGKVGGYRVYRPTEIDLETFSAIVLSSWHQTESLRRRATELFGHDVVLLSFEKD